MLKLFIVYGIVLLCHPMLFAQNSNTHPIGNDEAIAGYDTHIVIKGETLYSLSKKYNTTVTELLQLNPAIIDNNLQTGSTIRVPVVSDEAAKKREQEQKNREHAIFYTVQKKETLYSISKRYQADVETIMLWNDLEEPAIQEGQRLIVGYEPREMKIVGPLQVNEGSDHQKNDAGVKSSSEKTSNAIVDKPLLPASSSVSETGPEDNESLPAEESPDSLINVKEKGIATWVKSSIDDGNFYALHPIAPAGTEIRVTNPMNRKAVIVKVIGKLPATAENENVLIKISSSAAKKLGVLDARFLAELSYNGLKPEEAVDVR